MQPSVVVIGSFVQDLVFTCEQLPAAGETALGRFARGFGGKGSNQAVAAARAGAATRFVGAVGRDAFGAAAAEFHQRERIDSRLAVHPHRPTATAGIIVDAAGRNQIVVALGASAELRPRDVSASLLRGAQVVVAQHEASLAANARAFRHARRLGAVTVLNPAPMRSDFDPAILADVDVLIPNEAEFVALVNQLTVPAALVRRTAYQQAGPFSTASLPSLAAPLLQELCRSLGVPVVIVTLGERGCFVSLPDRGEHLPAHPVKAIDTTGAGDAFVGAFAAGLIRYAGDQLAAARFANAAAALAVTRAGAAASMPTRRAIDLLLRQAGAALQPTR